MKTKNIVIAIVVLASVAAGNATLIYLKSVESVLLVAKATVPVFATVDDSLASPQAKSIAELGPRQSVSVLRCVDVKHYQVYKVRLPDGTTGYVNVGEYALLGKDGKPSSC